MTIALKQARAEIRREERAAKAQRERDVAIKLQREAERQRNTKLAEAHKVVADKVVAEMLTHGPRVTIEDDDGLRVEVRLAAGDVVLRQAALQAVRAITWAASVQYAANVESARQLLTTGKTFTPKPLNIALALDDAGARRALKAGALKSNVAPPREPDMSFNSEPYPKPAPDPWLQGKE